MPRVDISIKTADGRTIVITPGDRLEKVVTVECNSARCGSRHGLEAPLEVSFIEGQDAPEASDQWMSLILPERSPQYTPMPQNFCSPQCVKDFLVYQYLAPGNRAGEEGKSMVGEMSDSSCMDSLSEQLERSETVPEAIGKRPATDDDYYAPEPQADGVGE